MDYVKQRYIIRLTKIIKVPSGGKEKEGEIILHKTIQALDHYLNVLPGDITTGGEQKEFETALFKILDDYNY